LTVFAHWLIAVLVLVSGCSSTRPAEKPTGPHLKVLTYNVNWGVPGADHTLAAIRRADADIVCLQETNRQWARYFRARLGRQYPFQEYRQSVGRAGGGMAFLSKRKGQLRAYVRSKTGWFDAWVMDYPTDIGPVQILNVHLQPQVDDDGRFGLGGLLKSNAKHEKAMGKFYFQFKVGKNAPPMIVVGDFNEGESGGAVKYLAKQGLTNALPEFDGRSPTWWWDFGWITWRMRLDHVMYKGLHCYEARVIKAGGSDHYPVVAVFGKVKEKKIQAEPRR